MLYAPSTAGFYDSVIHRQIPADAVEITPELHRVLLTGQALGKRIVFNPDTQLPELAERLPPSTDKLLAACKATARRLLAATDWAVLPDVPLANRSDFTAYRATVRGLWLNPITDPSWPDVPHAEWN